MFLACGISADHLENLSLAVPEQIVEGSLVSVEFCSARNQVCTLTVIELAADDSVIWMVVNCLSWLLVPSWMRLNSGLTAGIA